MTAPSQEPLKCQCKCCSQPCQCNSCNEIGDLRKELAAALSERDEAREECERLKLRIEYLESNYKDEITLKQGKVIESQSAQIEKLKEGMGELAKVLKSADTHVPDGYRLLKKQIKEALESARKVGM